MYRTQARINVNVKKPTYSCIKQNYKYNKSDAETSISNSFSLSLPFCLFHCPNFQLSEHVTLNVYT